MKYTKSVDGKFRVSIRPKPIRLTKEEKKELDDLAKNCGYKDYRDFLNAEIANIVHFSFEKLMELTEA